MPTFDTPQPISVTLDVGMGDIQVVASDRTDTVVDVRPSDPAKKSDVTAAEQTRVEYASGRLLVKAPKGWRVVVPRGRGVDRRADRASDGITGERRGGGGRVALHRSHRWMPIQDRGRRHPGRPGGPARPQSRCRRHHGGTRRRQRRGLDRYRSRRDRQRRRDGGGQELQRRHVDRRGHGRRAGESGQRPDHDRPGAGRGDREDRQRRRAPGRGRTWRRPSRDRGRHDRDRGSRRRGGLAGPQDGGSATCGTTCRRPTVPPRTRRRSTCTPGPSYGDITIRRCHANDTGRDEA